MELSRKEVELLYDLMSAMVDLNADARKFFQDDEDLKEYWQYQLESDDLRLKLSAWWSFFEGTRVNRFKIVPDYLSALTQQTKGD